MSSKPAIFQTIQSNPPMTRNALVRKLQPQFAKTTLYRNISDLINSGELLINVDRTISINTNPIQLNPTKANPVWNIPTVLKEFMHDSEKLPIINLAKNNFHDLKEIVQTELIPEFGDKMGIRLITLLVLLQAATDNSRIFEEFPSLPMDEEIRDKAVQQIQEALK